MRTSRLIEELRRENDRREQEAARRDRESAERIEAMHRETEEMRAETRLRMERIDAAMAKSNEEHRVMMAEMREHSQRMRVGFEALFGAFADLRNDIHGWRDEGGAAT